MAGLMGNTQNTSFYYEFSGKEFFIRQGDITLEKADALVCAANQMLAGGGGVDAAIRQAGGPLIVSQCKKLGSCPTGSAVVTVAGNLKAKMVIHTVGPIWAGGDNGEEELLRSAYIESLKLAEEKGALSIIFPALSTGVYGYPLEKAAPLAIDAIYSYLKGSTTLVSAGLIIYEPSQINFYADLAHAIIG